jgi:hypothetical protein
MGWTNTLLISQLSQAILGLDTYRETARFIGDISPEQVTVSNIQHGMTDVKWEAESPKGGCSCSADDMVRRTYCVNK